MITLFTVPKPFQDHIDLIQRNALQSWLCLRPECEIILCGDDPGVAETAAQYGLVHLPEISCNEFGTPLLDSVFAKVQRIARFETICYANADIIFLQDLITSLEMVNLPRYLMVGQRWNVKITEPLHFDQPAWSAELRNLVDSLGALYHPGGLDYFVFPRGTIGEIPPFAVGRPGWDNWMIYHARTSGIPVVDATVVNLVIHQDHDYGHVPQSRRSGSWDGPEADRNRELMGGRTRLFTLADATHVLTPAGCKSTRWSPPYIKRRLFTLGTMHPRMRPLVQLFKRVLQFFGLFER